MILNGFVAIQGHLGLSNSRRLFDWFCSPLVKPRVGGIRDLQIDCDGYTLPVRIYTPKKIPELTTVYFHGGGWLLGSIISHDIVARLLCRATGTAIVSVDYRLTPDNQYPDQIDDATAAINWLDTNVYDLPKNYMLAGDSAGAQVALYAGIRVAGSASFRGMILMYPALDPALESKSMQDMASGHFVTREYMQKMWKLYISKQSPRWPISDALLIKLPPVFVQAMEFDILRDEGVEFGRRLERLNPESRCKLYKGAFHGMMQAPELFSHRSQALTDIKEFVMNRTKSV